ncbi:MAG: hypothetical protein E7638_06420 [Ruminococcaceae bacterium]|nr:hypothetical protein [Oscillospiraceae bacterium]
MKHKHTFKKKILSLLAIPLTLGLCAPVCAVYVPSATSAAASIQNYDKAYKTMYMAAAEMRECCNLSGLGIPKDELINIYADLTDNAPELVWLKGPISYRYNDDTITSAAFNYVMSPEEGAAARALFDSEIEYIVSLCDKTASEAELALFVHDYFIASYGYDSSYTFYEAHELFANRRGVCQAYSMAYAAVLRRLGMDAVVISSDDMNHAWNLVKVDGEWYHVDLVYDDPTADRPGRVLHEHFLLSDKAISDDHYGWNSPVKCTSDRFDNSPLRSVRSEVIGYKGNFYYVDEAANALVRAAADGGEKSVLYPFECKWKVSGTDNSFWKGIFSGCARFEDKIYFNTPDSILTYSLSDGTIAEYLADASFDSDYYGLNIFKNTLEVFSADSPEGSSAAETRQIPLGEFVFEADLTDSAEYTFRGLPFSDIGEDSPYFSAVSFVYENKIFNGTSDTTFEPDTSLTRGMFVTVLGRLCGVDASDFSTPSFNDVAPDMWYSPYVEWAAANGIVNGVGNGCFEPDTALTREQMYKIIHKCALYLLPDGEEGAADILSLYTDSGSISDWARESIAYCSENGLVEGSFLPMVYPTKKATRAQSAELLYRFAVYLLDME